MQIRRLDLTDDAAYRATAVPIWQAAFGNVLPAEFVPDAARLRPDGPRGRRMVLGAFEAAGDSVGSDDSAAVGLAVVDEAKPIVSAFWVAPARRRHGIGSALLAESSRLARAAGHPKLVVRVAGGAGSEGFAHARGGRVIERDRMSGLGLTTTGLATIDLTTPGLAAPGLATTDRPAFDRPAFDRRAFEDWAAPGAVGAAYPLVHWSDHCPEALAASFCEAMAAMADAPGDAYNSPPTVETLREKEQALLRFGIHQHVHAALTEDGRIAGFTNAVTVEDQPQVVEVWNTAVVRAHRGHGLARRLKAAATLWILAEYPATRWIQTHNHEANAPIRRVNQALGYRPLVEWLKVEFEVG